MVFVAGAQLCKKMGRRRKSEENEPVSKNDSLARIQQISKKARNMFTSNEDRPIPSNVMSQEVRLRAKIEQEYSNIHAMANAKEAKKRTSVSPDPEDTESKSVAMDVEVAPAPVPSEATKLIQQMKKDEEKMVEKNQAVVEYKKAQTIAETFGSTALIRRRPNQVPKPQWHAPWKLKRVISGHLGWVRAIAVDPTNDWFVTGSADRSIKVKTEPYANADLLMFTNRFGILPPGN